MILPEPERPTVAPLWLRNLQRVTLAILAFAVLSYWGYTTAVSFDVPWGDHWRWIRFGLMPLERGDLSLLFLLVVMTSLLLAYGAGQVQKWRYYPLLANAKSQAIEGIRRVGEDPHYNLVSPDRRCDKRFCDNAIVYMKRGKRSLFRECRGLSCTPPRAHD